MRATIFSTIVFLVAIFICATADDFGRGDGTQTGITATPTYAALFPQWRYHRIYARRRLHSIPIVTTSPPSRQV